MPAFLISLIEKPYNLEIQTCIKRSKIHEKSHSFTHNFIFITHALH